MNPTTFSEALTLINRLKRLGFAVTTYVDQPEVFHVYRGKAVYEFDDTRQILNFLQGVDAQQEFLLKQRDEEREQLHVKVGKILHHMDWRGVRELHECTKKT